MISPEARIGITDEFLLTASRTMWQSEVGPVLYSDFARQVIVPSIDEMKVLKPFVIEDITCEGDLNLRRLCMGLKNEYPADFIENQDARYVSDDELRGLQYLRLYAGGFAETDFTIVWALEIIHSVSLHENKQHSEELSLADIGAILKTKWFGELANTAALTGPAIWTSLIRHGGDTGLLGIQRSEFLERVDVDDSDSHFWQLSRKAKEAIRNFLNSHNQLQARETGVKFDSIGCPVARKAFAASDLAIESLEKRVPGFRDDWVEQPQHEGVSKTVFRQGGRTAIEDVLHAWGRYFERCADTYPDMPRMQRSNLGDTLLLEDVA